jgi:hypothetical protein
MNITLSLPSTEAVYRIRELEIVLEGLQNQLKAATDPVVIQSLENAFNDLAHVDATLRQEVMTELIANLNQK